jgi:catechol 2,3-dioxygenase-like lactoylglutathione lyase family enzyme
MKFQPGEINIICTDVQASLHFYRDVLGFIPTTDEEGFYHLLFGGNQYLLLPIAQPAASIDPYGAVPQFSMDLMVDDLRAAYAYFTQHGVAFAKEWKEGARMFVIRDPDGLHWEVIQRSSPE